MTIEQQVYEFLMNHCKGKENLIKNRTLMRLFNVRSDKSMRKIIQNIREDKQFTEVVGSVSGKTGGNYICVNDEEIQETINNIKHRANEMLRMCYVLEWKRTIKKLN